MSKVSLYTAAKSLDELRKLCHKNGGPKDVFKHNNHETTLEEDIAPWIKDYENVVWYQNIRNFRNGLNESDEEKHKRGINKIKDMLNKIPGSDLASKGAYLREQGLRVEDICKSLDVSKAWYDKHCKQKVNGFTHMIDIETVVLKLKEQLGNGMEVESC